MNEPLFSYQLLKVMGLIKDLIPSERIVVFLIDGGNRVIFKESLPGSNEESGDRSLKIMEKAINTRNPVIIEKNGSETTNEREQEAYSKNALCMPLLNANKPVGAVYLDRNSQSGSYSRQNLELLVAFAGPIKRILQVNLKLKKVKERNELASGPILVGNSEAFTRVLEIIDRIKDSVAPVLISGESGTGKEIVARTIHQTSQRSKRKFVALNCGAIPEHLLESELFGYVKGSFTGALRDKPGLIEEANGGTFFLDEIGDLFPHLQAKLLRLLQEKEIRRIGENRVRRVDVRFISATNKHIEKEIEHGNFREDLYYRLKIISIELPPLRVRREDIFILINHFLEKYCKEMRRERSYFSPPALELLLNYSWPGNVRELQNEIQRCLILNGESNFFREECLSSRINPSRVRCPVPSYDFFRAKSEFEKRFLNQALARFQYNRVRTAEEIGLSRQGLFKLIKKHNIEVPDKRSP